jgi:hypothetical protein
MSEVTFRWLDGLTCSDADWTAVDKILEAHGWMPMHRDTSRVYLAEQDGKVVGISCLQFMPFVGPLWISKKLRSNGVTDKLADDTINWLVDSNARGWFVVADSPHVPKLCERHGMHRISAPIYITDAQGQPEPEEVM